MLAFPHAVRCHQCEPVPSIAPARPRPHPVKDPVAVRLYEMSASAGDDAIDWAATNTGWISDGTIRNRAYGTLALHLIDTHLLAASAAKAKDPAFYEQAYASVDQTAFQIRDLMEQWILTLADDDKTVLKKTCRRLYHLQHQASNWAMVRGIVSAVAIIPARGQNSADSLEDCVEWAGPARKAHIDQMEAARAASDRNLTTVFSLLNKLASLSTPDMPNMARNLLNDPAVRAAGRAELEKIWAQRPNVTGYHQQILAELRQIWSAFPRQDTE